MPETTKPTLVMSAIAGDPNACADRREPDRVSFRTRVPSTSSAQALIDAIPRCGLRLHTALDAANELVLSVAVVIVVTDQTRIRQYRRILKTAAAVGIPIEYEAGHWTRAYPSREVFEAALA